MRSLPRRPKLPKVLTTTVVALGTAACSPAAPAPDAGHDASVFDSGVADGGRDGGVDAGRPDAGMPDSGCFLPSDFPPDADTFLVQEVCGCVEQTFLHCYEENGPRCFSWACFPEKTPDGGYNQFPDGGYSCLC